MPDDSTAADPALVALWIRGWSLCRGAPPPQPVDGGWRVEVGWPDQRARLVFPAVCEGLAQAAREIDEPFVFLKLCAPVEALRPLLPACWEAEPRGWMMTVAALSGEPSATPAGYRAVVEDEGEVTIVRVLTDGGETAALGRVGLSGDLAVFDRIATEAPHRRRGLASTVMRTLEACARDRGARAGALVGTDMGRRLYESLGWRVHTPYSSAVIPGESVSRLT